MSEGGSLVFLSLEIIVRSFFFQGLLLAREKSNGVDLFFFALIIESGTYCYQNITPINTSEEKQFYLLLLV